MPKTLVLACVVAAAAAAAWGRVYELKRDTGTFAYTFAYPRGYDAWFGNDFDLSERSSGYD